MVRFVSLLFLSALTTATKQYDKEDFVKKLNILVTELMAKNSIPGLTLGVADFGNDFEFATGYGVTNINYGFKNDHDIHFFY
jgi:hypothetical protein